MSDLISRQAAIDALHMHLMYRMGTDSNKKRLDEWINNLPSVQPENQVHLCDSCRHVFPECSSEEDDVIYGNGKGNDNICACNKYEPSAQPEQRYTEEELRVFAHGISLSLLSKRSAQYWKYDKDTATEIEFLERLYEKVGADIRGEES